MAWQVRRRGMPRPAPSTRPRRDRHDRNDADASSREGGVGGVPASEGGAYAPKPFQGTGPAPGRGSRAAADELRSPFESYMAAPGLRYVGRNGSAPPESDNERHVILPAPGNLEPRDHAWCIARFAAESMAEHAALLASLMPPETAGPQRQAALTFHAHFVRLQQRLDGVGVPAADEVQGFCNGMADEVEPFIDAMRHSHDAQVDGTLRSNVWPSLFELARRESEHWALRLRQVGAGQVRPSRREVVAFWAPTLAEHAAILARLVDPSERAVVDEATRRGDALLRAARDAGADVVVPSAAAGPLTGSIAQAPVSLERLCDDAVAHATQVARLVEAGQLKGILTPALADNLRRKALWFHAELEIATR